MAEVEEDFKALYQ
jgi:hypothetical protein